MALSYKDRKNLIILLFVGLLLCFLRFGYSFSLTFNNVSASVSVPLASIIGYILLLVYTSKIKGEFKDAKGLFIVSIIGLVGCVLQFTTAFIPVDASELSSVVSSLSSADVSDLNAYVDTFNAITAYFKEAALPLTAVEAITGLCEYGPLFAGVYFLTRLLQALNASWNGTYDAELIKKHGKRTFIFGIIMAVLSVVVVYLCFRSIGAYSFATDGENLEVLTDSGASLLGLMMILGIGDGVIAILYIVYMIKFMMDIYRVSKGLLDMDTPNYVSYQ